MDLHGEDRWLLQHADGLASWGRESAEALAEALLTLDEPWRSRFLTLLASRAAEQSAVKDVPTREEVVGWLRRSDLRQELEVLLRGWARLKR